MNRRLEVLVCRRGDEVTAARARCSYLPLRLPKEQDDGVVTCTFHGARSDLGSGECRRGPLSEEGQGRKRFGMGRTMAALTPGKSSSREALESHPARISGSEVQVDFGDSVSEAAPGGLSEEKQAQRA